MIALFMYVQYIQIALVAGFLLVHFTNPEKTLSQYVAWILSVHVQPYIVICEIEELMGFRGCWYKYLDEDLNVVFRVL